MSCTIRVGRPGSPTSKNDFVYLTLHDRIVNADAVSSASVNRGWVPPALLAAYAVAFGWRALAGGLLVFDDHPGQIYRLAHAITLGGPREALQSGLVAGYAELQYYPPGFAWLGALIHLTSGEGLGLAAVYQILLWLAWLLPGVAVYALLRRVLGDSVARAPRRLRRAPRCRRAAGAAWRRGCTGA